MKTLITILIVVVVLLGAWKLWEYWDEVNRQKFIAEEAERAIVDPARLEGLPYQLEPSLQEAQRAGAAALKQWLETYKRSPLVRDPRLAWIELDYVVQVSREDPVEAKRIFAAVKDRTPTNSPVYPRIKALEKTYQ